MLEAEFDGADPERATTLWERQTRRMLDAVGWGREITRVRRFAGGASFYLSAPIDTLYAATEVNEWACDAAGRMVDGGEEPQLEPDRDRLVALIDAERRPALLALQAAARDHGVRFLSDELLVTVGSGSGSVTWPADELPEPASVDWSRVHDVPVALITGSNGKTTSTRLLAAVLAGTGQVSGYSCTDSIHVGEELLARGDYAGPGGARALLRDRRVELAVLETARGGILRRGLAVERAEAAMVTNVAADHLGEYGIRTEADLADAKLVVTRAVGAGGTVVLNADDPLLRERAGTIGVPITWITLDPANPLVRAHTAAGGLAVVADSGSLVLRHGPGSEEVARLEDIPITVGGAAAYNVANALGVVALAAALGVPLSTIAGRLAAFRGGAAENPGRLNVFELGGLRVVLDFAHNPHGMSALVGTAGALPARRRLILLGQAGDRDDAAIRELVRAAAPLKPDAWAVKDMDAYLRGRAAGEVPAIIADEIRRVAGSQAEILSGASELDAVKRALRWARTGDLLVLTVHAQRDDVLALIERLRVMGWRPGQRLR